LIFHQNFQTPGVPFLTGTLLPPLERRSTIGHCWYLISTTNPSQSPVGPTDTCLLEDDGTFQGSAPAGPFNRLKPDPRSASVAFFPLQQGLPTNLFTAVHTPTTTPPLIPLHPPPFQKKIIDNQFYRSFKPPGRFLIFRAAGRSRPMSCFFPPPEVNDLSFSLCLRPVAHFFPPSLD